MAHLTSFKASGAVGVLRHDERREFDEVHRRKNECIDPNKTHLNYNMAAKRSGTLMQHIKRVCDENNVRLNNRKDLNVMSSWVITAPKTVDSAELPLFFKTCYDFLSKKYGKQYTLSATVHMDETTPHLHYCFLPVGLDTKNNRLTVSSKLVLSRSHLRTFHNELENELTKVFGRELGILNEATKDGNKEIQELKYQTAVKRTKEAEQLAEQAETRLKCLQGRVLKQEEVNALKGKKTLTGGLKGIKYDEYLCLKETAQNVNAAKVVIDNLRNENERLSQIIMDLQYELQNASTSNVMKHQTDMAKLKSELENERKLREKERRYYKQIVEKLSPEAFKAFKQAEIEVRTESSRRSTPLPNLRSKNR